MYQRLYNSIIEHNSKNIRKYSRPVTISNDSFKALKLAIIHKNSKGLSCMLTRMTYADLNEHVSNKTVKSLLNKAIDEGNLDAVGIILDRYRSRTLRDNVLQGKIDELYAINDDYDFE